ncbi:MAG: alternative ribosome rescue aminoacyl-tRNA hydrolase ArfB [Thermoanaerobaculia bacterium]
MLRTSRRILTIYAIPGNGFKFGRAGANLRAAVAVSPGMIVIDDRLSIPDDEVRFEASRSSGPGGQHVNTSSTRVSLIFDLSASRSLDDATKARVARKLSTRISAEGLLRVTVQKHRSQKMNREAAMERFAELLRDALTEQKPRRKTRPTAGARARRVDEKKKRGGIKKIRTGRYED